MKSKIFKKPALTLDASLVQDDLPLEVVPRIFVGSIHSAFNLDCLVSNGITHILNASRLPVTFPKQFTYLSVEIRDRGVSNILSCIPTTNIFIEAAIENGGVLVHCFGGKSRSPAFIAAFLMSSRGWSFDEAYNVIKAARPIIDINPGFECQLRAYGAANCDVYIAQQLLLHTRVRELKLLRGDTVVLSGDCKISEHIGYSQAITATANLHSSINYNDRHQSISNIGTDDGKSDNSSNEQSPIEAKGSIDIGKIPAGMRVSGRFDLNSIVTDNNNENANSPKLAATAATYDATALNTEHEQSFINLNDGINNTPGVDLRQSHKKRAFNSSRPTSHENPQRYNDVMIDNNSNVNDGEDDAMDIDSTDGQEERTIQNLAAAYDTMTAHAAMGNTSVDVEIGGEKMVVQLASSQSEDANDTRQSIENNTDMRSASVDNANLVRPKLSVNIGDANGVHISGVMSAPKGSNSNVALLSALDRARIITEVNSPNTKTYSASPNTITQAMQMPVSSVSVPPTLNPIGSSNRWGDRDNSGNRTSRHSTKSSRKGGRGRGNAEVEVKTPVCRLSQPGSRWVRVIPPLRGLEREFKCSWCNTTLFTFANVLRPDLDLCELLDKFHNQRSENNDTIAPAKNDPIRNNDNCNVVPPLVIIGANGEAVIPNGPRSARSLEEKHSFRINSANPSSPRGNVSTQQPDQSVRTPRSSRDSKPSTITNDTTEITSVKYTPRTLNSNEMDIESAKQVDTNTSPSERNVQFAPMPTSISKPPIGGGFGFVGAAGQRTSRAAQAKGFDFDIPTVKSSDLDSRSMSPFDGGMTQSPSEDQRPLSGTADSKDSSGTNISNSTSRRENRELLNNPNALPFILDTQTNSTQSDRLASTGRALSMIDASYNYSDSNNDNSNSMNSNDETSSVIRNRPTIPPRASSMIEFYGDDSPRVAVPPHRLHEQQWSTYFNGRPQSAEKRRWLARMNLIRNGDVKVAKLADDDDSASINAFGRNKYLHIEYLDWMGLEVFDPQKETGNIQCFSCKKAIGAWSWSPTDRLSQELKLESPVFRIHKHVVHHSDVIFDATPRSTPRPEDMINSSGSVSRTVSKENSSEL